MRAAQLKKRPAFALMKQGDIQNIYYMQMPRWLFSDPRYAPMSLEAKMAYTFLLNRFQISRRKGWVNESGEVFVIFPRKALAQELRVCEKRVIAAFRQLAALHLIWEKRCGRGDANQIYLARVEPAEDPDYACVPFCPEEYEEDGSRTADRAALASAEEQELPDLPVLHGRNGCSRTAETAVAELPIRQPSKKEKKEKEQRDLFLRPSVGIGQGVDGQTDEKELERILDGCELDFFSPDMARVLENAIERLYYSDALRIGTATIPGSRVRARLRRLDREILQEAERKLECTEKRVKNATAYIMSVVFNCIAESDGELLLDPYLNQLRAPVPARRC